MNLGKKRRGAAAFASSIVLATFGLLTVGVPVNAIPGDGGTGTLTIHKYEQPSGDLGPSDGSDLGSVTAIPVEGVKFSVCQINNLDLATSADWEEVNKATLSNNGASAPGLTYTGSKVPAPTLGTCTELSATDATGVATTSLAADRAYAVYESSPLSNTVTAAQPFIITVPFPGNGTSGQPVWNYDPHVYPKNTLAGSGATKNGMIIGNKVTFDVTVPVIPLLAGDTYSEFIITDTLNSDLTYSASSVMLTNGGTNLLSPGDYTLVESGGTVTLTMTTAGRAKLDANIGGVVTLTINADAKGNGNTSNKANIQLNGARTEVEIISPQDFFSGAHVKKNAQNKGASTEVPLAGATFMVYSKVNAATITACPATQLLAAADFTLHKVDTDIAPFVSGTTGMTPTLTLAKGDYCVYETEVPAGYKGETNGKKLTVDSVDTFVTFLNTQVGATAGDLPNLPITGAQGQILMMIIGVALVSVAGGVYLVRRRRSETTSNQD